MSEILTGETVRTRNTPPLYLLLLTFVYSVIFITVFRQYAYAEPSGFPEFYATGKLARFDPRQMYSRHLQDTFHPGNQGVGYFFHLPYEAILFVPLSYLPQTVAYACWTLLNLACLLGVALILRRHFHGFSLLVPFAFAPTLSLVLNSQDIGVLALLVAVAFDRFATGKDIQAGIWMALGLFRYPLVVPLAIIVGIRFWKVLAGFLECSIPLLGLSAAVVGTQGIHDYLALTLGTDAKEDPAILVTLRGAIGEILGPHVVLVIFVSILCVVLAATIRSARIPTFCIAVITTILVSWHAHLYDTLLLLIPMAWMLDSDSQWIRYASIALLVGTAPILVSYAHAYFLGVFLSVLFGALVWDSMRNRMVVTTV